MKYNFDEIIDRRHSNALARDGFRKSLFKGNEDLKLHCPDEELVSMWIADMDFAVPPAVIEGIKQRLEHPIFGYTLAYEESYFEAFIKWAKKYYHWDVVREHIVTSQGVIPALYDLVDCVCTPNDQVLTLTPCYAYFKHSTEHFGNTFIYSDLIEREGHFLIDFDDFRRKAENKNTRLFFLCNPHNPTGRIWTEEELLELGRICLENNVLIVSDDVHCDLLRQGATHTPIAKLFPDSDQIVTCMAPSKTFNLAGMMIANIVIPDESLRATWKIRHYPFVHPLSIDAARSAFEDGHDWLCQLRSYLDDNFRYMEEYLKTHLPKAVFHIPEATYLAWIDVGAYKLGRDNLTHFFAQEGGLLMEGGHMFVANGEDKIRINVACPRSKLEKGLGIVADVIHRHTD